ncbi:MAG TPA: EamA family transporter [Aliidongia sp.]|uniref:aromatic amino acid exporter YddG n=1 Tax=Aliidongia sp. TaxID=1914230 RepID=UPI002DDCE2B8|nr:EamA family transporter [Aliidongia sp.]HEV2673132.1 EamA family transporter [Aliidongia sp.]
MTDLSASAPRLAARNRATAIGGIAILLWASLALLATLVGPIPPFQLVAMSFGIAFAGTVALWLVRGEAIAAHLRQRPVVWLLGIGGLFGYHFLYFVAVGSVPPVEASLLNYLWPLLIVLFSGLVTGERLRWWHVLGALCGLFGVVVLVTRGFAADLSFGQGAMTGYAAALGAAVIWAAYSVVSRTFGEVPTDAVGGFCGATAVLALLCHLVLEPTVWPTSPLAWGAVLLLGLGPVGGAFFAWDHGVKRGNIRALSGLSYGTALMSTLLLIAARKAEATPAVGIACLAIVGGAVLASRDLWHRPAGP